MPRIFAALPHLRKITEETKVHIKKSFAQWAGWALLGTLPWLSCGAYADTYPDHPITIVVPFSAGGGADIVARMLARNLAPNLGNESIIVDNKAGASGNIGANYVARAKPDGYTLLLTNSTMTINASLGFTQGYDVKKNLVPVANLVSTPIALAVNSKLPVKSVADLVAYAKQHKGRLSYSSCGTGTPQHFAGADFDLLTGLDILHVPYKGCAPAVNDGLSNQVPILFSTIPNVAQHAKAGQLRLLGVASKKRLSFMPDVPAIAETAPFSDMDISVWFGLFAPAGIPQDVRQKLEKAVLATMQDKKLQDEYKARYYEVDVMDSRGLGAQVDRDLATYKKLAAQSHISLK